MSKYSKLVEEFFTRYERPEIEELIVGFSGIDPQKKTLTGIIDHEQLENLLGGDDNGHYHLTREQWEKLIELISEKYPPEILEGQTISVISNEEITPYEVQGINVKLTN